LLETIGKQRVSASVWIARNLLELLVWIKYCGVSMANARRFHEDTFRDIKGLIERQRNSYAAMGILDKQRKTLATLEQARKEIAYKNLGLEDINSDYLRVQEASKAKGVDVGRQFDFYSILSKFAHPTAVLVRWRHQFDTSSQSHQALFTTLAVGFAMQSIVAIEAQLGIPPAAGQQW
jgi:hypothetical protein